MVKKDSFDFKKLMVFGSIPTIIIAVIGFIVVSSKTITVYADLPKEVEQTRSDVVDVKEYIKEQKMANDLMQKIVTKNDDVVISPDGKSYYDESLKKWRPLK